MRSNCLGIKRNGFTLIEALVFLFIFIVTTVTFYSTFTLGVNYILETKMRLTAIELANEKMEITRSLQYADIGTQGSIDVPGDIDPQEDVIRMNRIFRVITEIGYKDDGFDGTVLATNDNRPNDYKQIKITVSWDDFSSEKSVIMTSLFAAPGIEPPLSGGILSINVLDALGNGISGATVKIINNSVIPNISDIKTTDSSGNYLAIGSPESNQGYEIEINKDGYYPVRTYAPYSGDPTDFSPVDVHASVVEGTLNTKTIITDKTSDIKIISKDFLGNPIPEVDFSLKGGRKIGENIGLNPITDKYDFEELSLKTDSLGEASFFDMSFGVYFLKCLDNLTDYVFVKVDPGLGDPEKFDILPGQNVEIEVLFANKNINSLWVKVKDSADEGPIEGARIKLKNDLLGINLELDTDENGYAYFAQESSELVSADYELTVSASGFSEEDTIVNINNLVTKDINLSAI